jgi:hypothetical protein
MIFNGEMVRAILDGRKTQTRRMVKPQVIDWHRPMVGADGVAHGYCGSGPEEGRRSPYGTVGDIIWVRETFLHEMYNREIADTGEYESLWKTAGNAKIEFVAGGSKERHLHPNRVGGSWMGKRPSIHMPRWASRIDLEVTAVRVERVQEISEEDAKREGVNGGCLNCGVKAPCGCSMPRPDHRDGFAYLWDSIYANWDTDPFVWVYEFRRVK